jgi:hypothetical protein
MASQATADAGIETITAKLNYLRDTGETPWTYSGGSPAERKSSWESEPHEVTIRDGRPVAGEFSLECEGFRFLRHDTAVKDFYDEAEVRAVYYPEMEALVARETGAARIVVFDHTVRTGDEAVQEARKVREPVPRVHNDYTEWSGPQRLRDMLPEEADALLRRRFAIVQVWRPIRLPVETMPLAMCDATTIAEGDMVVAERRYPGRVGQTYAVRYNPRHQWYWIPKMRREEAFIFKVYDSARDGRARWTAHTAFENPLAGPDAGPRESIEIRTLALFEGQPA